MTPYRQRAQAAARAGLEAHIRLTMARQLRYVAIDALVIDQPALADELRRLARNLDAQRRRIGG